MLRNCVCAVFVLVLFAGVSLADEMKGKIKKVDPDKNTLTVTDDKDKDHTFTLDDKTEILDTKGEKVSGGLKGSAFKKEGEKVTITYDKTGDKVTVKKVKLGS